MEDIERKASDCAHSKVLYGCACGRQVSAGYAYFTDGYVQGYKQALKDAAEKFNQITKGLL